MATLELWPHLESWSESTTGTFSELESGVPACHTPPASARPPAQASRPPRAFEYHVLLPSSRQYIERIQNIPLLPAPPAFEEAFARFEPMFHTVFYRRYPNGKLDDAKQDALLHLWKEWRKNLDLFEQTAAFVVQAAIWGASPHRKIQKEKTIAEREVPMPQYERYVDVRVADLSREPMWVQRTDLRVDLEMAVNRVRQEFAHDSERDELMAALDDLLNGRTRKEGRLRSSMSIRVYQRCRNRVVQAMRETLAVYSPSDDPFMGRR
ncbi:MAG: hypothetical protein IPK19_27985 [Chloroflexi bacterium]|nr:hypothetical protein [Chloroflexota bacterium]